MNIMETINTTDTPRTYAIEFRHCPPQPEAMLKKHEDSYALSRKLERELAASQAEVERLTSLLSLEREGHEGTKKLCAKIIDSTRKTPSMEWHRKNNKVLLK